MIRALAASVRRTTPAPHVAPPSTQARTEAAVALLPAGHPCRVFGHGRDACDRPRCFDCGCPT